MLRNEEDAREALQDAFLAAFRGLPGFDGSAQVSTWLHRILVNTCLMKLRARRRKPEQPLDPLLPSFLEDGHHAAHPRPWDAAADAILELREEREFVRAAIDRLPVSYRTVLLLRDIEELDSEEAAQVLGITTGALKVRLHRARQALRTLLEARYARAEA
jgi:RNA polymerase sigma-70 factor (ECF subfamily)